MQKLTILLFALLSPFLLLAQDPPDYEVEPGSGKLAYSIKLDDDAMAMEASPDGKTLAIGADDFLILSDFSTGKMEKFWEIDEVMEESGLDDISLGSIRGLCYLDEGKKIALAMIGGIVLMDIENGKVLWHAQGHPSDVPEGYGPMNNAYCIRPSADGKRLMSTSMEDKALRFWSVSDGSAGKVIDTGIENLDELAISPDGEMIAVQGDKGIKVYSKDGAELWSNPGRGLNGPLTFSPDNAHLAASTWGAGAGIAIVNAATGEKSKDLWQAGDRYISGISWTEKGKMITAASGSGKCPLIHWKSGNNDDKVTLEADYDANEDADNSVAVGLDGTRVAVAGDRDEVRVYKLD